MDANLLETCSDEVRSSIKFLHETEDTLDNALNSTPYYVLDFVNSDKVKPFIKNWPGLGYDPGVMVYENIDQLVLLLKLEKKYNPESWKENDELKKFASILKSEQTIDGAFRISDFDHTGGLWFMVHYEPKSTVTENAVDYFISDIVPRGKTEFSYWTRTTIGAIALSELDPHYYERILYDIRGQICEHLPERLEEYKRALADDSQSVIFEYMLPYILVALAKLPESPQNLMSEIGEILKQDLRTMNFGASGQLKVANSVLGLIANGQGPKKSVYHAELARNREIQRWNYSKPEFISTYPTTSLQTRRREIYEKIDSLINSVENELRISTLRIDMFHDEIIDLIRDSEVSVKILTRQEAPGGNRKRIKKAVINELILETEDEVRGDDIIHSRMVIGDDNQLISSTADMTRTQLVDEFNSGIYTRDQETVKNAIEFFDNVWSEAEPLDTDPWNR